MSYVIIDDIHLHNIGNAIRSKNETENTYKPSEMAGAISELEEVTHYIDPTLIDENKASGYLINRIIKKIPYINTSEVVNMSYMFSRFSALEELQEIDCSSANNITAILATCSSLYKFGGFRDLGKAYLTSASSNNTNYILNMVNTVLDHDSLMNVINKIYDIKSLGVASQTIRLSAAEVNLLSDEEKAIATSKGWNIST